ncbi:MAG: putative peroxidase [Chthoniobacteraceae bacterium]|nr:putative peroxidase [Chthoniobacteraceae bacterium]
MLNAIATSPNLDEPISWKDPSHQRFLQCLQGNILKGHGREHTVYIFLKTLEGREKEARAALNSLANRHVTSALKQLQESEKETGSSHDALLLDPFLSILLTHKGYEALGVEKECIPQDRKFLAGMRESGETLNDPVPGLWEQGLREPCHVMILVGVHTAALATKVLEQLAKHFEQVFGILHVQTGKTIRNANGDGIEHFGFIDSHSQPLCFKEDMIREVNAAADIIWDPVFSPKQIVVADPGAKENPDAFGSYFIFRKLEERVRAFKRAEQQLADDLGLSRSNRASAEPFCIGRLGDCTPVNASKNALMPAFGHVPYLFDEDRIVCEKRSFHSPLRMSDPDGPGLTREHPAFMASRGITYEDIPRNIHPDQIPEVDTLEEFEAKVAPLLPEGELGLLFMAYNGDIARQFEATQCFWARNAGFPSPASGSWIEEPKQAPKRPIFVVPDQNVPRRWTYEESVRKSFDFRSHVVLQGGDYFFAPSLDFLKSL